MRGRVAAAKIRRRMKARHGKAEGRKTGPFMMGFI